MTDGTRGTTVANQPAAAGCATGAKSFLIRFGGAEQRQLRRRRKFEAVFPPLMLQPRFPCHSALQLFIRQMISFSAFDETSAGFNKTESDVCADALVVKAFYPVIIQRAGTVVIFATGNDLFDLSALQVFFYVNGTDERCCHQAFVFEREAEEKRNSFISPLLIFAGNVEKDVFPAFVPIRRKTFSDSFGAFGQQEKNNVRPLAYDFPSFRPPDVGFFQKEVRCHADANLLAAFDFVGTVFVFLERVVEIAFYLINISSVGISLPIQKIHVTVLAAFAFFDAAMPGIPNIVHIFLTSPMDIRKQVDNFICKKNAPRRSVFLW